MSTTIEAQTNAQTNAQTGQITHAVLERGRFYHFSGKEFLTGEPQAVTPDEIKHLRKYGVDQITLEGEDEYEVRQKFRFLREDEVEAYKLRRDNRDAEGEQIAAARPRQRERRSS